MMNILDYFTERALEIQLCQCCWNDCDCGCFDECPAKRRHLRRRAKGLLR